MFLDSSGLKGEELQKKREAMESGYAKWKGKFAGYLDDNETASKSVEEEESTGRLGRLGTRLKKRFSVVGVSTGSQ